MMKKNYIIALLILICFLLVYLSSSLYNDIKDMKIEAGIHYKYSVDDTRYLLTTIMETNMDEALQTEYGKQFLSNLYSQLWDKVELFHESPNRISEVGNMLWEIGEVLEKSSKQGTITEEEEFFIKEHAKMIKLILVDIYGFAGQDVTWYDLFNESERSKEINKKIDQRINGDY